MANPVTTARTAPSGIYLKDGHSTKLAFARQAGANFWEVEIAPPGFDGTMQPMDGTINDDPIANPGSGADRLGADASGRRVVLSLDMCTAPPSVPAVLALAAVPHEHEKHSHEWAVIDFTAIGIGSRNAVGYDVKVSTRPIVTELDFVQAEDAKANTLDFQGLDLCPIDAGSNQPVPVSTRDCASAAASSASALRNQALIGVTNPIFGR